MSHGERVPALREAHGKLLELVQSIKAIADYFQE
jgi:hypothetical protein